MKKNRSRPDARGTGKAKRLLVFFLCALCALALPNPAAAAAARPEVIALANGARLVVSYEPDSPLVAIDIFFRVGYAEENEKNAGITALLSRAWVSSVEGRGAATLGADIGGLGGNVGTAFGGDYVELWAVTAATEDAAGRAAQTLIQNVIGRPRFSDAAVAEAKKEQLRALALQDDPLRDNTLSRLRARLWDASPYARSPEGTEAAVGALTAEQVRAFYDRYFRPDRAVIVVAGNIRPERARRLVEANMGSSGWRDKGRSPAIRPIAPESLPRPVPTVSVNRRARATVMMAGFVTPGTQQAAEYPALLLLDALVGSGKTSRLFRNLREARGIGYEIGSLLQPGLYQGLLAGYVVTDPYRIGPGGPQPVMDEVSRALVGEMKGLITRPPGEAELARAKALVTGRYALRHQRLKDRAFLLGWSETMGLGAAFDTGFDARIGAVTLSDIKRLAQTVLGAHHVLAVTLPD
jgi:predicted Zn-dependent peptidase